MKTSQCLTDQALRAYQAGTTDAGEIDATASHLSSCSECLARLQTVDASDDPLLSALRRQQELPDSTPDPLVATVVSRVLDGPLQPASTAATEMLAPGSMLNEYRLLEKLGGGGMGTVYRALHIRLEKEVALKVIRPARSRDDLVRQWFEREMRAIGRLRHGNIVLATDAGEAAGVLYLVMELEQGVDLARYVRERGPLPVDEACEFARQAALGLQAAHEAGLVHRDVKPSNLFRTPSGQIKLLDLGLARLADAAESASGASHAVGPLGTREYMAPEQWTDPDRVDARADLYGLGCTLFYLLTSQPPFATPLPAKPADIREAHLRHPPRKIGSLRADAPPRLQEVMDRLLAKSPDQRWASASEVAHQLSAFVRPPHAARRWPALAVTLLSALVLAAVAVVAILASGNRSQPSASGSAAQETRHATAQSPPPDVEASPPKPPPAGVLPMNSPEAQELQRRWAVFVKQPVTFTNSFDMEMALVPPGSFRDVDDQDTVVSRPYYVSSTEVTMKQFRRFAEAERYVTENERSGQGKWSSPGFAVDNEDLPVVQLTWNDALAFCLWLGKQEQKTYRLPTGAEWGWAARCGQNGLDYLGSQEELAREAWGKQNAEGHPHPVGTRRANAWGIYDLHGNVSEWCQDDFDAERLARLLGRPAPFPGLLRIAAGSSCMSQYATYRLNGSRSPPSTGSMVIGFRVACELPQ